MPFCFGGTIALEVARRLMEMGKTVSLVALVQTVNSAYYRKLPPLQSLQYRFKYIYARFSKYGRRFFRGEWNQIYAGIRDIISWQRRKQRSGSPKNDPSSGETLGAKDIYDDIALLATIGDAFDPKPYPGRIHLIRAEAQAAELENDMTFGWQDIARDGVEVYTLPGNHYSLLEKPNVSKVATTLESWLAKQPVGV